MQTEIHRYQNIPTWIANICVLIRGATKIMKHHEQKQLGEERFYFIHSSTEQVVLVRLL